MMRDTRGRPWLWILPITWAILIFTASADSDSSARSSRIIGPIVRWLMPHVSPETVDLTVFAVRKAAHVTEYAILAILIWLALGGCRPRSSSPTRPSLWAIALLCTAAYAVSDEFHQSMVAGRTGAPADVFLDVVGAAAGLFLMNQWCRWRDRRKHPPEKDPA